MVNENFLLAIAAEIQCQSGIIRALVQLYGKGRTSDTIWNSPNTDQKLDLSINPDGDLELTDEACLKLTLNHSGTSLIQFGSVCFPAYPGQGPDHPVIGQLVAEIIRRKWPLNLDGERNATLVALQAAIKYLGWSSRSKSAIINSAIEQAYATHRAAA